MRLIERLWISGFLLRVDGLRVPDGGAKNEHLMAHLAALEDQTSAALLVEGTLDDLAAARAVGARCVLCDGGSHDRQALEATDVPVVDRLTAALAAAVDTWPGLPASAGRSGRACLCE